MSATDTKTILGFELAPSAPGPYGHTDERVCRMGPVVLSTSVHAGTRFVHITVTLDDGEVSTMGHRTRRRLARPASGRAAARPSSPVPRRLRLVLAL